MWVGCQGWLVWQRIIMGGQATRGTHAIELDGALTSPSLPIPRLLGFAVIHSKSNREKVSLETAFSSENSRVESRESQKHRNTG
jgi:hypothetical protein